MVLFGWRDELGDREFGVVNHFEMLFLWRAETASVLQEFTYHLSSVDAALASSLREASVGIQGALSAARDDSDDEESQAAIDALIDGFVEDQNAVQRREHVLHHGLFLAAYSEFERILIDTAEEKYASLALKAMKPDITLYYGDTEDLLNRMDELRKLRNELAHGGRRIQTRGGSRSAAGLAPMIERREVMIGRSGILEFEDGFLQRALEDLYRCALVALRVRGPLRSQLDWQPPGESGG